MRKYILFLLLLCMQSIARGQTGFDYRYWFDNDDSKVYDGHSATGLWQVEADLDGLSESLHAIHLQVVDAKGNYSSPVTRFFLKVRDTSVKQGYYWFDDEQKTKQTLDQVQGLFSIDVSKLAEGFHTFYYQVVGRDGSLSAIVSRSFYKVVLPEQSRYRCWVDDEPSTMTVGKYTGEPVLVDISQLSEGYHVMRVQIEDVTPSAVVSRPFVKIPQTEGVEYLKCLCVIDDKLFREENVPSTGGIINWNFDVSSLPQGFHRMQVQVITPSGAATSTYDAYFLRTTTTEEMSQMKCVYAIDGADFNTEAGRMTNGAFHCDLDVAHLEDGLHRIAYKLTNGYGVETKTQTQFFIKTPLGGNGITEYRYWLNDSTEQVSKVKLAERTNPYRLISLLPVPKHPVSSKLFQFELTDGQPMIYAKNNIHIRFYDAAGRFTDETAQFVDYSVKQEVTDVDWLESGVRATTAKPAENAIKWYCLEAETGDSLQFKLDRAATIQLFVPSGEEIHAVSGSEAVKWNGLHVRESGTYYLALHDVTAQQGTTVSIDYNHIDKYAVLRQDVTVVGNGGCSTITFEGNGFDELESVDLYNSVGYTIRCADIQKTNDAEVAIIFDFSEAELGKYHAVFHFDGEDKHFTNMVTVEAAKEIELASSVNYSSTYLRGTSTTYTLKIKNSGNMTAYDIPIYLYVSRQSEGAISKIELKGRKVKDLASSIYADSIDTEMLAVLDSVAASQGLLAYLLTGKDVSDEVVDSVVVSNGYIWQELQPYGTATINLILKTSERVNVWFTVPKYLSVKHIVYSHNQPMLARRRNNTTTREWDENCVHIKERCYARKVPNVDHLKGIEGGYGGLAAPRKRSKQSGDNCQWTYTRIPNCPPLPPNGGASSPVNSLDPNDIYGYLAESGSRFIRDEIEEVNYRIEFENDPEYATAAAHVIEVADTLDATKFDLSTYTPTSIKIGEKYAELSGDMNSLTTVDMRPKINAIAQIEGTYNQAKGIAKWKITSLDPMTMEPTDDPMDGVLPVNYNGNGIGEVSYNISLKPGLAHGTEIPNRAGIVFDNNATIMTPTWTNTIDRVAPESHVADVQMATDTTAAVRIAAADELSGPWRYDVYVQYGTGSAWFKGAENVPIDSVARVKVYEGIDHGFYTVVTDSAGNVEQKEAAREFSFEVFAPQVDTNTKIELAQGWNWISHNQQEALAAEAIKPKAQRIVSQTDELFNDSRFGWTGDLDELLPTELYKVQMAEADEVQLSGKLFNAAFRSVPLYEGWNWMGYPVANVMTPAEALQKMEAEEGDFIIGQDGMATFTEGQWAGTLTQMQPGQGYMYRSVSDKNLFLNATAQSSSRRAKVSGSMSQVSSPDGWTVDKRKYPNVMGLVADLLQDGETLDANEWLVAAFCGEECRGLSQVVNGHLMMNVYGQGGERITFMAQNRESGEVMAVLESEPFRTDILGTMQQPYELHSGIVTGIAEIEGGRLKIDNSVYDLQGRRVENSSVVNGGVYIVTDGAKIQKHVNLKRNK